MLPLIIGSLLAVAAVAYVLYPLIAHRPAAASRSVGDSAGGPVPDTAAFTAIDALREIEFDRATGKLSDTDYATLKAEYTPRALEELRAREKETALTTEDTEKLRRHNGEASNDSPVASVVSSASSVVNAVTDPAEALISAVKQQGLTCPTCGTRPEPDALFCSNCGRELVAATAAARSKAR